MKEIPGEERERYPPFNVKCPRCEAEPGFACRKPNGEVELNTHKRQARQGEEHHGVTARTFLAGFIHSTA